TNLILTNGWDWRLYRNGKLLCRATMGSDSMFSPTALPWSPSPNRAAELHELFLQFIDAPLVPYKSVTAAVDALASRARAIKLSLLEIGASGAGDWLKGLRDDFRTLLYKNGRPFTWERFVDSYVQIAVFGSLLWKLESGKDIALDQVVSLNEKLHPFLY